jgi:hypothetical protein
MRSTPSGVAVQRIDRAATDVDARRMVLGLVHGFPVYLSTVPTNDERPRQCSKWIPR